MHFPEHTREGSGVIPRSPTGFVRKKNFTDIDTDSKERSSSVGVCSRRDLRRVVGCSSDSRTSATALLPP